MDYFDNDDEDDWIFDVPLPGEKRLREEEEEDDWIFDVPLPGEKRLREEDDMRGAGDEVGARTPLGPPKKGMVEVEREPPLMVYADFEAMTDERGLQTPVLVCYETSENDENRTIYGTDCTQTFIAEMEEMAIDEDEDDEVGSLSCFIT